MKKIDLKKPFWFWLTIVLLIATAILSWSITISGVISNSTEMIARYSRHNICNFAESPILYTFIVIWNVFISSTITWILWMLVRLKVTRKL